MRLELSARTVVAAVVILASAACSGGSQRKGCTLFQGSSSDEASLAAAATPENEVKPNVYVYFTGVEGPAPRPEPLDEDGVVKWLHASDPIGLVYAVSWRCGIATNERCIAHGEAIAPVVTSAAWLDFEQAAKVVREHDAVPATEGSPGVLAREARVDDAGVSRALQHLARFVDLLVAISEQPEGQPLFGDLHFLGHSVSARAASVMFVRDVARAPWTASERSPENLSRAPR